MRLLIILALLFASASAAVAAPLPAIPQERADSLRTRQVSYDGIAIPFGALATQATRAITGRSSVAGLDPTRFIASLILYPEAWVNSPIIRVKGAELRRHLHITDPYISPAALYDTDGTYIPTRLFTDGPDADLTPRQRRLNDQILDLDARVELIGRLVEGTLFTPLPDHWEEGRPRPSHSRVSPRSDHWEEGRPRPSLSRVSPRSDFAVAATLSYYSLAPWRIWAIATLSLSLLMLILGIIHRPGHMATPLSILIAATAAIAYAWQTIAIGRPNLNGDSAMMLLIATFLSLIAPILPRFIPQLRVDNRIFTVTLAAGAIAIAGWSGIKDAMPTPLMPGLQSPWLPIHVTIIILSYSILLLTLPAAIVILLRSPKSRSSQSSQNSRCSRYSQSSRPFRSPLATLLIIGDILLFLGILTGSIWAKTAWGRYWAWDPKENWAAITLILYILPLILPAARRSRRIFALTLIIAFLSMLMTYYGVNFLDSIHAYR